MLTPEQRRAAVECGQRSAAMLAAAGFTREEMSLVVEAKKEVMDCLATHLQRRGRFDARLAEAVFATALASASAYRALLDETDPRRGA